MNHKREITETWYIQPPSLVQFMPTVKNSSKEKNTVDFGRTEQSKNHSGV